MEQNLEVIRQPLRNCWMLLARRRAKESSSFTCHQQVSMMTAARPVAIERPAPKIWLAHATFEIFDILQEGPKRSDDPFDQWPLSYFDV
jgi:hypothetical protein